MALFGKKKKEKAAEAEAAAKVTEESKSDLDLIKEAMAEADEEREARLQEAAKNTASNEQPGGPMPTPEEIRKAQEILARAGAAGAQTQNVASAPKGARVGVNAPVNTASLKAVVNNFVQSKTQDNLKKVMDCLQNPKTLVCVPAQIITSKENEEKMKQGGEVKLEGPVRINPVILTDNTGKKLFPIFTGEDAIPDDIKSKTPKVNMPLGHCLNLMKGMKDVDTLALDPYTANIRIGVNANEQK
ncbi:MAG: SseB family protein [Oscillospiraceae bacterium]|nr:SseB family protein [Oscillospiraceae bacterium]